MASGFKFSSSSRENMIGVEPHMIEVAELALEITHVDFGIPEHGGFRTTEEQKYLFRTGKSNADGTDLLSPHQEGQALDFFAWVPGVGATWDPVYLAMVGAAFLQAGTILSVPLSWGGLWTPNEKDSIYGWDMGHIEIADWKERF